MSLYNTDLVVVNKYSRPAFKLLGVKGIVIHWTANPGGTDTGHKTFFDGSDGGGGRYAGCHFFVDKDSATLIIPLDEVAYHANDMACRIPKLMATASYYKNGNANLTTIGIEMCVEKDGTIHPDTISRTVELTSHLCTFYKLETDDIYRHFDITGKNCPAPWVQNPQLFVDFKNRVKQPVVQSTPAPSMNAIYQIKVNDGITGLNIRNACSFTAPITRTTKEKEEHLVFEVKDGMYRISASEWITANEKYVSVVVDFTKPKEPEIKYIYTGGYVGEALLEVHNYLLTTGHGFNIIKGVDGSIIFLIGRFDTSQSNFKNTIAWFESKGHYYKLITESELLDLKNK